MELYCNTSKTFQTLIKCFFKPLQLSFSSCWYSIHNKNVRRIKAKELKMYFSRLFVSFTSLGSDSFDLRIFTKRMLINTKYSSQGKKQYHLMIWEFSYQYPSTKFLMKSVSNIRSLEQYWSTLLNCEKLLLSYSSQFVFNNLTCTCVKL